MPNKREDLDTRYVSADEYVKAAKCGFVGRTLQRWCDQNPHLAESLGELVTPGTRKYDVRTAPHFRKLWIEAQKRLRAEDGDDRIVAL